MAEPVRHEYAGFQFDIWLDPQGRVEAARARPGQHSAAYKDKHRRAAIETYEQDHPK